MNRASGDNGDEQMTGLPGGVTWRWVYVGVTLVFLLYVVLLALLPRVTA